jgi:hypothetical protein
MLNLGDGGDQNLSTASTWKVLVYDKFCQDMVRMERMEIPSDNRQFTSFNFTRRHFARSYRNSDVSTICPISTDICFPCFPNASMLPQLSALVCDVTSAPFFHFFALAGGRVSASESGRAAKSRSRPAITLGD